MSSENNSYSIDLSLVPHSWIKTRQFYHFSATLVIRQGRITSDSTSGQRKVEIIPVISIATVELGGDLASRPTYFFDCITDVHMNNGSGIKWTRMDMDLHRFDVGDIPSGNYYNATGRRMNVGGITYGDLGVYICSDSASDDSVSVNITGCKLYNKR